MTMRAKGPPTRNPIHGYGHPSNGHDPAFCVGHGILYIAGAMAGIASVHGLARSIAGKMSTAVGEPAGGERTVAGWEELFDQDWFSPEERGSR